MLECPKCFIRKARPIRQLMADLPAFCLTAYNKPFKFCGLKYLSPLLYRQGHSDLCARCILVELVTSLDLNSFRLAFSRFINLRAAVDISGIEPETCNLPITNPMLYQL